ncbi:restriction endonuclease subunit S [Helicobacter pylori]|nr:restriction endonuclease subunit S [Helicobacter pylori]
MSKTLQDYATLINDTIQSNEINHYITTDNMCQNLGGIDTFKNINIPQGKVRSFQKDDILLSNIRLYFRKVYRAKQKGGCSSDVLVFRAKHIDSATLFAILSSQIFTDYACSGSQGSKMPRGNKTHMMNFKIPTINFTIAKIFNSIQNKIENNHKINELLHKILELLYEQYFVRFDFLDENNKPYQISGGKMKFSKELNRLIPNDFEVKTLGELTQLKVGNKNANHSSNQGKYPFFTCSNNPLKCETYQFEGKHIIISGNGNFYVTHYDGKFDAYQRTYVVNPNNPNHYVLIYLFVKSYTNYLKLQSRGSIIKFITKSDIENIKIVLPNLKIYTKWNNVLKMIENNMQSTQTLTALRDFLLPLLLKQQVKPQRKILEQNFFKG